MQTNCHTHKNTGKAVLKISKIILYCAVFLFSTCLSGQTGKTKKMSVSLCGGYAWQGTHNIELGFQPMLLLDAKKDHSNIGLVAAGNILFYKGSTYLTPVTKLRIMPHKRKKFQHLAWFASLGHSYTSIQNKYDHRISPELGVKWEWYNLSIGYNIPVSGHRDNCTTLFRAAFSFNLF